MSKDKDSKKKTETKPATPTATAAKQPWWKLGLGKPKGDAAKTSGTSPPVAAAAPAPQVPPGTPPDIDLSGLNFDGDGPGTTAPAAKRTVDGAKLAKRRTATAALAAKHYPILLGAIFHTENWGDIPGAIDQYLGTLPKLPDAERRVLWLLAFGAAGRFADTKFAAAKGADEAARKNARRAKEAALAAVIDAYCEIDPISPPSNEDLLAVEAALFGSIGGQFMHEASKAPDSLKKPETPKDPNDSGELPAMPGSGAPAPKPSLKGQRGDGGTPILAEKQPPKPESAANGTGGMGKGSLVDDDSDTIGLAEVDDDKTKDLPVPPKSAPKKK